MRADEQVAERVRDLLGQRPAGRRGAGDPDDDLLGTDDPDDYDDERRRGDDRPGAGRYLGGSDRRPPPGAATGARELVARLRSRLPVRVGARVDPGHRGAFAVGVTVLVAALLVGGWLLLQRPQSVALPAAPAISGAVSPMATGQPSSGPAPTAGSAEVSGAVPSPGSASSSSATVVVVDVAGRVARPGVYSLPSGSRVADALTAAGGALHGVDLTSINLAAELVDGEQVVVGRTAALPGGGTVLPTAGAADPGAGGSGGGGSGGSDGSGVGTAASIAPVDLNTANLEQLENLPGIGPALGQRILDWRAAHGSFRSIDQLNDVSGIGDVKFAALRPHVTV